MPRLDIDSMRALTAIADTGGITRAAARLNLSQSAVSHKVKRLEQRLNRNLLMRVDGKTGFTRDGEKLLEYARRMVRLHDEAWTSFHQSDLAGELRLGITEDITAPDMAHILSNFSNSFPHVALTSRVAHTPELLHLLDRGDIDMALIEVFETQVLDTDYPLGRQQVVWLQAEDYILEDGPIPYVTYHSECFYKSWAEQAVARIDRSLRVVFECPSLEGMVNAVQNGLGIGLVNFNVFERRQAAKRTD
ncbi:MAG TPA: LysR family transcriptional regulator, partial [Gammaproteobacteria bacterium]|nr:LysR family transcriptional regulator [Gammaproteobacteria bacterium]